jgi:glycosyltransferase involved in cell wall biosynthesis
MKKLLILTSTFPKSKDDAVSARFVFDLAKALCRFYDVHVLVPHSTGLLRYEESEGLKIHRFIYFLPLRLQILGSGEGLLSDLKSNLLAYLQIPCFLMFQCLATINVVIKHKIDIVNTHWIVPQGLVCALIGSLLKFNHVLTVHAADIFTLKRYGILGTYICRFILKRTDIMLPVSNYIKEQVREVSHKDITSHIIPMGVDTNKFKYTEDKDSLRAKFKLSNIFTFLFVGKFSEKKGIEFLIKASAILQEKGYKFKLILVGGGPLYNHIAKLVEAYGVSDNVRFLGWTKNELLPEIYSLGDVIVVPSVFDRKGETEGMPVVIQESMACGIPVLASEISGIPDIVKNGENGWLIKPADELSLANKMEEVMDLESLDGFRKQAIKTAKNNSYLRIAERYYRAIEK